MIIVQGQVTRLMVGKEEKSLKTGYLTTSDNARIYYEDRGSGTPIVFVPGHMCTSKFFERNAVLLAETYRVITMDPRGFGNSSKVLYGNTIERNSDDVKELIEYLELKDVMLVGWSLGGSIVMTYAHKYRELYLKSIGLIDCALFPFAPDDWNQYNAKNYNMDEWCNKYNEWWFHSKEYYGNFMKRIDRGLSGHTYEVLRREIAKTPPWIGFAVHTDWCHTNTEQYLAKLSVPVLLIAGEDERMCRHYFHQLHVYKEFYEFPDSGHAMFLIEPEKFNQRLRQFMERVSSGWKVLVS